MKIKQLDDYLLKIIVILSLATGYFFNVKFFEFFGFQVTFFTISIVIIFILGFYLTLKVNFMHLLTLLMILVFYLLISVDNRGFETYGIIFFTNVLIIYLLIQKNIEASFLSNLVHVGLFIGLLIFIYYIYEMSLYGDYVELHKELWNSTEYAFRFTMGSVFSFQGFSINPNVAIIPFLASFFISEINRNRPLLSFIYILFIIIVAIATNSRGTVAMVVLVLSLFLLMRYSFKNILKVFLISSLSLFFITLVFINSKVLDKNYSNPLVYFENISDKFETSTDSQRLEKISNSIEIYKDNPLFGEGLSVVKEKYDMSTENGYVEYLAVFGSVGVLIFFPTSILWFYRRSYCLNNGIAWPLVMIYLIINIFNVGYMHPVISLILGLSFMCFNPKNRVMPVNINKNKERTNFT